MRRLKLQVQMSLDGMVAAQNGHIRFNWDEEVRQYSIDNLANVDYILLGRKTAEGFIPHWKSVGDNPSDADVQIGARISDIPKIVFSAALRESGWPNATIESGEIVDRVNRLKNEAGGDLLVYGGSSFVASLIQHNLIDEYHLLVNPIALGRGAPIFTKLAENLPLSLVTSRAFSCGTVLLGYERKTA